MLTLAHKCIHIQYTQTQKCTYFTFSYTHIFTLPYIHADSLQSEYSLIFWLYIVLISSNISSVNRMVMEDHARRWMSDEKEVRVRTESKGWNRPQEGKAGGENGGDVTPIGRHILRQAWLRRARAIAKHSISAKHKVNINMVSVCAVFIGPQISQVILCWGNY